MFFICPYSILLVILKPKKRDKCTCVHIAHLNRHRHLAHTVHILCNKTRITFRNIIHGKQTRHQ